VLKIALAIAVVAAIVAGSGWLFHYLAVRQARTALEAFRSANANLGRRNAACIEENNAQSATIREQSAQIERLQRDVGAKNTALDSLTGELDDAKTKLAAVKLAGPPAPARESHKKPAAD
jgi:hypothetical protein